MEHLAHTALLVEWSSSQGHRWEGEEVEPMEEGEGPTVVGCLPLVECPAVLDPRYTEPRVAEPRVAELMLNLLSHCIAPDEYQRW